MEKDDLYFASIDDTHCQSLEYFLHDAKIEGLTEITLVKADPDDGTTDFIWCTYFGECVQFHDCKKSECSHYESKSGRGRCRHKGSLYTHGEEITFKVD